MNEIVQQPAGSQHQGSLPDAADLRRAFGEFNNYASQLEESYRQLQLHTSQLARELAAVRGERHRQQSEKEKLADRLEKLLTALPGGVLLVDGDDVIQTANRVAERLFGISLVGLSWHDVTRKAIKQTDVQDLVLNNGRILSLSVQKLDAEHGKIVLLNDVTRTRTLQEAGNRQQRLAAMGQMAASLAHQVRTPLSSAVLYASQLSKPDLKAEHRVKAVDKIRTSLRYLEKLINDMLMFAKGGEFTDESIKLGDLLALLRLRCKQRLADTTVSLKFAESLDPGLVDDVVLQGSRDALVSLMMNLFDNAVEHSPENTSISIEVFFKGRDIILAVTDQGPGLDAEQQQRIFEPFFSTRTSGTGLGLPVARAIAKAHHGSVDCKSIPGKGSRFYLRLPLAKHGHSIPSGANNGISS